MDPEGVIIRIAGEQDQQFAQQISDETERSAIERGSGISRRSAASIIHKMKEGKAVVAVTDKGEWVGYSYVEVWSNGEFLSNSGLIVSPAFRRSGVAAKIKRLIFELGKKLYPAAKMFSITTGLAIMKMNARLGFEPVTFSEITQEDAFWEGCKSCVNYSILQSKGRKNCLCTAMLYIPSLKGKVPMTEDY